MNNIVLGADIGGSHITTALINLETQELVAQTLKRERVNPHGSPEEIVDAWVACIQSTTAKHTTAIHYYGIAMPGPFDYEAGISKIKGLSKFDALYGLNIKEMLAERLYCSSADIRMMNDAGCFLQGEVFSGAAKGYQHVIGLTLGTGLGTARYHAGSADDANLWCFPFKDSIAEEHISTRFCVNRYQQLTGNAIKDVKALAEIYEQDPAAQQVFKEFGTNLGQFLVEFIKIDQPQVVIIGGNIANAFSYFKNEVEQALIHHDVLLPICLSQLKEEAALIGAASLWAVQEAI